MTDKTPQGEATEGTRIRLGPVDETGGAQADDTGLTLISADEVKPEEVGVLSLRYVDGTPTLVISGGQVIPQGLKVVDAAGEPVAFYTADPATPAGTRYYRFASECVK
ncbi:hypothetical protein [Streptomyces sp. NPDC002779]|uniref:hypothetical protein n=1 Tax=Streptomyces sp. NPDC002779 TaxID=3364664 RepID=UPI003698D0B1